MQSYSLNQSCLLDPSQPHPSPPTVFALSHTSHLLLSASDSPPLIYLTNLILGTRPVSIRPQCSSSAVVAAGFHPERPNIFVLAFADGSAAVYDAVQLFNDKGIGERKSGPAGTGVGGEIASIKRLHAVGTWVSENERSLETNSRTIGIGYKGLGITATAFVPGFKDRAVTVGADGKCCVVDFAKRGARLVNTWHIRAPATSLAILSSTGRSQGGSSQVDGANRSRSQSIVDERILIAIGRQDGKVVLFDLTGNPRGERSIDPSGKRIIDMEWMSGDGAGEHDSSSSKRTSEQPVPLASVPRSKRKSLGSILASGRPVSEEVAMVTEESEPPPLNISLDSSTPQPVFPTRDRVIRPSGPALNHLDLFSPVKPALGTVVISGDTSIKKPRQTGGASERVRQTQNTKPVENLSEDTQVRRRRTSSSQARSAKVRAHPPVPQRPTPRKVGQLAAKRVETARLAGVDKAEDKVASNVQSMTSGPQFGKGLRLFAPYMKKNVLADPQKPKVGDSSNATMPGAFTNTEESAEESTEDPWLDIITEPPQPSSKEPLEPSPATTKSYRTAHCYPSEASNDTIVTWSAGDNRQPALSFHSEAPISNFGSKAKKERKKGHVSLTQSTDSDDTTVQWSSFKPPPKAFYVHEDPPMLKLAAGAQLAEIAKPAPPSQLPPSIPRALPPDSTPLGEASHNVRPPPCPPKLLQPQRLETDHRQLSHCSCFQDHETLLKSFKSEMTAFKLEAEGRFEKQKQWIEKRVLELEEGRVRLEGENRKLREELAKERRRGRGEV